MKRSKGKTGSCSRKIERILGSILIDPYRENLALSSKLPLNSKKVMMINDYRGRNQEEDLGHNDQIPGNMKKQDT